MGVLYILCSWLNKDAKSDLDDHFRSKMLMRGDFDLNSMHAYTGSLNDVLRKTMLNQEVVFKDQVLEYILREFCVERKNLDQWTFVLLLLELFRYLETLGNRLVKKVCISCSIYCLSQFVATDFLSGS